MKITYTARALPALSLAASLLAAPALAAEDRPAHGPVVKLVRCLAVVDLSEDQKSAIRSYLESQKPAMEAILRELRQDRQALEAALDASPADACAVGAAALDLKADRAALRVELQAIRAGVEGYLTPEQKTKLSGCLAAPRSGRLAEEDGSDDE